MQAFQKPNYVNYRVNSKVLRRRLMERGLTYQQASNLSGVALSLFSHACTYDRGISMLTYSKLTSAFGADVAYVLNPRGEEKMKTTVTITREDGTSRDVEIHVTYLNKAVSAWGEEEDVRKALTKFFADTQKVE